MNKLKILAIESSCDDSAIAILDSDARVLSNIVISQNEEHAEFGGIVPEIASRSHLDNLEVALQRALEESDLELKDIDLIAVCSGPGLVGSLIVGVMYAKTLASIIKKPIIEINHLEGHILSPKLENKIEYPYLALLISGGHTQFVIVNDFAKYLVIGRTLDDALGECFDKVAKMLGLPFPGGAEIEKHSLLGNKSKYAFTKPLFKRESCDFSFSGLKTEISLFIKNTKVKNLQFTRDVSASFQKTISEILCKKSGLAIEKFENHTKKNKMLYDRKIFALSGGVACNSFIRESLSSFLRDFDYDLVVPSKEFCKDNASMIAFAALERLKKKQFSDIFFEPKSRWALGEVKNS